jgi:hypothetical protein
MGLDAKRVSCTADGEYFPTCEGMLAAAMQ